MHAQLPCLVKRAVILSTTLKRTLSRPQKPELPGAVEKADTQSRDPFPSPLPHSLDETQAPCVFSKVHTLLIDIINFRTGDRRFNWVRLHWESSEVLLLEGPGGMLWRSHSQRLAHTYITFHPFSENREHGALSEFSWQQEGTLESGNGSPTGVTIKMEFAFSH